MKEVSFVLHLRRFFFFFSNYCVSIVAVQSRDGVCDPDER